MKSVAPMTLVLAAAVALAVPAMAGDAAAGKEAHKTHKCSMCHQIEGAGGKMGGALDDIGSKKDADTLKKYIKDPKSVNDKAKMKAFPDITDKDLDDLVAYLMTLKGAAK